MDQDYRPETKYDDPMKYVDEHGSQQYGQGIHQMKKTTLAVIVGNRDFFPDELVTEARKEILKLLKKMDIESIILTEDDTKLGGVETWDDATKCAALFKASADEIDGILVLLPNFGDEKGVADTVKLSGL